jgi:hypothetical protein
MHAVLFLVSPVLRVQYTQTAAVRALLQMGVLAKIPRNGSITAKELASGSGMNEEVLSMSLRAGLWAMCHYHT